MTKSEQIRVSPEVKQALRIISAEEKSSIKDLAESILKADERVAKKLKMRTKSLTTTQ